MMGIAMLAAISHWRRDSASFCPSFAQPSNSVLGHHSNQHHRCGGSHDLQMLQSGRVSGATLFVEW